MKLIVGLGNPGQGYEWTRHNFGFLAVEAFAKRHGASYRKHRTGASVARIAFGSENVVVVAKSSGFMNESGSAVAALKRFYKIRDGDLIIVHDDIDLPFGTLRIGRYTSSGGHKGIQSILDVLKNSDFIRVRLGIAPQAGLAEQFVLEPWSAAQKKELPKIISRASQSLDSLLEHGLEKTASLHNSGRPRT